MIKNRKGFTLVELLAVITILGILMIVAIPAVSRTIENSRRNTFLSTAKTYTNAGKEAYAADNVKLNSDKSSATILADGNCFAIRIQTTKQTDPSTTEGRAYSNAQELVNQGGLSSWGNADVSGWLVGAVGVSKGTDNQNRQVVEWYVNLIDAAGHGINFGGSNGTTPVDKLTRADVFPSSAKLFSGSAGVAPTTAYITKNTATVPSIQKKLMPGHTETTTVACKEAVIQ